MRSCATRINAVWQIVESIRRGYAESGRTAVAALARLECYYFSVESINNICIRIKEANRYLGILVVMWFFNGFWWTRCGELIFASKLVFQIHHTCIAVNFPYFHNIKRIVEI